MCNETEHHFKNKHDFKGVQHADVNRQNLVCRKQKEPDTFDGKKIEWPDYIAHFEQVALWNQWTKAEKALRLTYV